MEMNDINDTNDILFKPLLLKQENNNPHVVVFIHLREVNDKSINDKKEIVEKKSIICKVLDVSSTIEKGYPDINTYQVDLQKVKENLSFIDIENYKKEFTMAYNILLATIVQMSSELEEITSAGYTVSSIVPDINQQQNEDSDESDEEQKELIIADNNDNKFVQIKFDIKDQKNISAEEIQKIIGVIVETTKKQLEDIDITNQNQINELKDKIEYEIIDVLPPTMKIGDIAITNQNIKDLIEYLRKQVNDSEE